MEKFKQDKFRRSRGGTSQRYGIGCVVCCAEITEYQKDGIGTLHRLYLDRLIPQPATPPVQALRCPGCDAIIGQLYEYKPESRLAYRLIPGTYSKHKK